MGALLRRAAAAAAGVLVAVCGGGCSQPAPAPPPSTATSSTSTAPATGRQVLAVTVVFVPVCGPSSPAPTGCDPRPLPGAGVVAVADGGGTTRALTDAEGVARLTLAPGGYEVRGEPVPSAATPRPTRVTVAGTGPATVTIRYESTSQ